MKIKSEGAKAAEDKLQEISKSLTVHHFNSDVHILCEDGSSLYLKNARHRLWEDVDGNAWVLVFTEHMADLVFPEEDLLEYATIPNNLICHPPIPWDEEDDKAWKELEEAWKSK